MAQKNTIISEPKTIVLGVCFDTQKRVLLTLNKDKDGILKWMFPGGKIDDLLPPNALIKEFDEEFQRKISVVGSVGLLLHQDRKGDVLAYLYRIILYGNLETLESKEPDNIIKPRWLSQDEIPMGRAKSLEEYPISPLTWKILYSLRNIDPWKDAKRAPYHSYIIENLVN